MSGEVFFVVWREETGKPTPPDFDASPRRKHSTRTEADAEAARLARKHPGSLFHVLISVGWFEGTVTVRSSEDDR